MRRITLVSMLFGASICASANAMYNLNGVTFSDGATASGSFTINTALNALVSWSINITGSNINSPNSPNYNYTSTPSDSSTFTISATEISFAAPGFSEYLVLYFTSSLGGPGPINFVTGNSSVDCNSIGTCGGLTAGNVSMATPEPASLLLATPMLLVLGAILYRRKRLAA